MRTGRCGNADSHFQRRCLTCQSVDELGRTTSPKDAREGATSQGGPRGRGGGGRKGGLRANVRSPPWPSDPRNNATPGGPPRGLDVRQYQNWEVSLRFSEHRDRESRRSSQLGPRSFGNHTYGRQSIDGHASYDGSILASNNAPSNPNCLVAGDIQLCGLYDIKPTFQGRVPNVVTHATRNFGASWTIRSTGYDVRSMHGRQGSFIQGGLRQDADSSNTCKRPAVLGCSARNSRHHRGALPSRRVQPRGPASRQTRKVSGAIRPSLFPADVKSHRLRTSCPGPYCSAAHVSSAAAFRTRCSRASWEDWEVAHDALIAPALPT